MRYSATSSVEWTGFCLIESFDVTSGQGYTIGALMATAINGTAWRSWKLGRVTSGQGYTIGALRATAINGTAWRSLKLVLPLRSNSGQEFAMRDRALGATAIGSAWRFKFGSICLCDLVANGE